MTAFNPILLRLARERAGMTQRALTDCLKITQAAISKYESGKVVPTRQILEKMAQVLGVYPQFFEQRYEEAASGLPHHRKFTALPAKIRQRIEAEAKLRMRDACVLLDQIDDSDVVDTRHSSWCADFSERHPEKMARRLRTFWAKQGKIDEELAPIHNLCACVEALGVRILEFDFGTPLLDGFFLWYCGQDFIVLNASSSITADRRRFTLAHELGHAILHRECFPGEEAEREANTFASELLLPEKTIGLELKSLPRLQLEDYKALKARWWVSIAALGYRARELKVLSEGAYRSLCINLSMLGLRKNEPLCGVEWDTPQIVKNVFRTLVNRSGVIAVRDVLLLTQATFEARYGQWLKGGAAMPQQAL